MKAIIWTKYGSPEGLKPGEVDMTAPKNNEVLVKIRATTVTAGDVEARAMAFSFWLAAAMRLYIGLRRPKRVTVLGQELAGDVVEVGKSVTKFKPGDRVFGTTGFGFGAYAEYICLPENAGDNVLAIIPDDVSYFDAAVIPTDGLEALHFIRKGGVKAGDRVLVNGAGGSIGSFGIQLAKLSGAEVTGVDSADKLDMLRSIGADHVIDYAKEDFGKGEKKYDVVLDVVGRQSFKRCIRALKPNGRYLLANPRLTTRLRGAWVTATSNKKVITEVAGRDLNDLEYLGELIETGKIRSVIGETFPFEQTAEAHRHVEAGHKLGNVVISVCPEN